LEKKSSKLVQEKRGGKERELPHVSGQKRAMLPKEYSPVEERRRRGSIFAEKKPFEGREGEEGGSSLRSK